MITSPIHRIAALACVVLAAATTACGSDDDAPRAAAIATTANTPPTPATSVAPPTTAVPPTTAATTSTTLDESWRDEAAAWCTETGAAFLPITPPASPDDAPRFIEENAAHRDQVLALADIDLPKSLTEPPTDLAALVERADGWLTQSVDHIAAGTADGPPFSDTGLGFLDRFQRALVQMTTILSIAGVPCGADPARVASADLNLPIYTAYTATTGFGSVWVAETASLTIDRINPDTGEVTAAIAVGSRPYKMHVADGRLIVRTADAYEAIDPATNTVVATLAKADVGASANRNWAVDGAMWICDGQRLHRYDPTTLQPVTTIELGFECGHPYATDDLVVAWTFEEDLAESGAAIAAFVDPATNSVMATLPLPVDVGVPVALDDIVFFPALGGGSRAVVVDRATWTTVATPDLGGPMTGSVQPAVYDGTSIYVILDQRDIVVVDPATFEVTETIEPFDFPPNKVTAVTLSPGALWVTNIGASIVQRFDR
jgi:streptogramin lyase